MLRFISVLCLVTVATQAAVFQETPANFTGHQIFRVVPNSIEQLNFFKNISTELELEIWNDFLVPETPVYLQVPPQSVENVKTRLHEIGAPLQIVIEDFQRAIDKEREENSHSDPDIFKRAAEPINKKFHSQFHRIADVDGFVKKLAKGNSKLATLVTLGTTYEERPILGLRISSSPEGTKPAIFVEGGIHAREWASTSTALYIADVLVNTYETDPAIKELVDKYEWHVFPCVNPDGYVFSWDFKRTWRKNRSTSKKAKFAWCRGTDPNRNFDTHHCELGANLDPCSEDYCGDDPFSEKESVAIAEYLKKQKDLQAIFDLHSFSQYWLYPYGYTLNEAKNHDHLSSVAETAITALKKLYGTEYIHGPVSKVIYLASGSAIDWAIDNLPSLKLVYAIELRDKGQFAWMLPKDQILPTSEEAFAGIVAAVKAGL